jgi:hydroxyquinol 1,2-dioxygenase
MRNITEHNITDAVVARFADCADPRLKQVMGSLVRHLHAFVRDVQLTEAEWEQGIGFLTDTGHRCTGKRQEFILLSDTLGVSMLVTAMNQSRPAAATEATVFGPFHTDDAPALADGADLADGASGPDAGRSGRAPGRPLWAEIEVTDLEGRPLAGAEVDIWQADAEGLYDVQRPELGEQRRARAVMFTDALGQLRFRGLVPTPYPVPTDGPVGRMLLATGRHPWRPAHVHFRIRAEGYATLITHLFRDPDPYLDSDVVFGVRSSLVARFEEHGPGRLPDGTVSQEPFCTLRHRFVMAKAAKASGR